MSSYGLLDDDGFARTDGGMLVREDCPEGCCDGTQLFWKLTPCACTPNGFNRYWTDRYKPSYGCVWAEIDGKCYYICPDSESKETLGPLDVNVRPALNQAEDADDACAQCCAGPGLFCCEENTLGCGLNRETAPYVSMRAIVSAALSFEEVCTDLDGAHFSHHEWNQPCSAIRVDEDVAGCYGWTHSDFCRTTEARTPPCEDDPTEWTNQITVFGLWSLRDSVTHDVRPIADPLREKHLGTATTISGVVLRARLSLGAGWYAHGGSAFIDVAVSKTTGDWWAFVRSDPQDTDVPPGLTANMTVQSQVGCGNSFGITFDIDAAGAHEGIPIHNKASGSAVFIFDGIAPCDGGSAGAPTPPLAVDPNTAAIEAAIDQNPMQRCRGCGG